MIIAREVHRKIIEILKEKGPSLPIQIAGQIGIDSLFISAFLSELVNEKKIKISYLKVGGSPLYLLEGQEQKLQEFCHFLPPKESEAVYLLKEKGILKDSEQEPAIRVALRSTKDFAIPFKKDEEIFWRFHSTTEQEVRNILEPKILPEQEKIEVKKMSKEKEIPEKIIKEIKKKKTPEIFLEEVKSYLKQKDIELVSLESFDKKEIIAKIRFNLDKEKVHLLFAYNKKKLSDKELLKAYKKSSKYPLDYKILFKGEFSKKLKETIEAHKKIISVGRL